MTSPDSNRFDDAYRSTPPWEIGAPQRPFLSVADGWRGPALDAGCGTGELAMAAAERGLDATGIDGSARAIAIARQRAADRALAVDFIVGDVLTMPVSLGRAYNLVFDSGVFHVFDDEQRVRYIEALAAVTAPGGRLLLMCFSDAQSGDWGPRRISKADLTAAFADGWVVDSIEPSSFALAETFTMADRPGMPPSALAWFGQFTRL